MAKQKEVTSMFPWFKPQETIKHEAVFLPPKLVPSQKKLLAAILHYCLEKDTKIFTKANLRYYYQDLSEEDWNRLSQHIVRLGDKGYLRSGDKKNIWELSI